MHELFLDWGRWPTPPPPLSLEWINAIFLFGVFGCLGPYPWRPLALRLNLRGTSTSTSILFYSILFIFIFIFVYYSILFYFILVCYISILFYSFLVLFPFFIFYYIRFYSSPFYFIIFLRRRFRRLSTFPNRPEQGENGFGGCPKVWMLSFQHVARMFVFHCLAFAFTCVCFRSLGGFDKDSQRSKPGCSFWYRRSALDGSGCRFRIFRFRAVWM